MSETVAPDVLCCTRVKFNGSIGHIMVGGPVYTIKSEEEGAHSFTFEWHPYFGPSRCNHKGDILGNGFFPQKSKFWDLFDRWMAGGKRVDQFNRCVLASSEETAAKRVAAEAELKAKYGAPSTP